METVFQQKLTEMWHPTAKWCYFVAFVIKEKLPREHGVVPYLLRMIREMLPNSKLIILWFKGGKITDAGRALSHPHHTLWFKGNEITATTAIKLAEMLPNSKLTTLWIENYQITDAIVIKLAEMLPSSNLTELVLNGNQITDVGAVKLAEALPSSKLTWFNLENNQITDVGIIKQPNHGYWNNKTGGNVAEFQTDTYLPY